MKKTIIAGAASLALAAMPVMGVFAATSVTDTITADVDPSCTFVRTAGEGTYATTLTVSALSNNFASSTLSATCNEIQAGKTIAITASFTDLVKDSENSIPYSATAVAAGTAGWNAAKGEYSATAQSLSNNSTLIDVTEGVENAETVWYSVATSSTQTPGAYKGYATYTLAEN